MAWTPQRGPQLAALEADWCDELFFGGARGGGKSDYQLGYQEDGALRCGKYSRGIMFRKTYPELEELQGRAMQIFPASGAIYKTQPSAQYPSSNTWYWPSGAQVKMRYIEHERDYGRYHGHQYNRVSFDELTEYETPAGYLKMISCLRSAHGIPCSIRGTGNPGGVGHQWVKARFITNAPPRVPFDDPETGLTRLFIPSRIQDNRILLEADPKYIARLRAIGSPALVRAWLEGDWDIIAGAFFPEFRYDLHVVRPFEIPAHWTRFRSFDWGSARPFSCGWWAVSDGEIQTIPRGALVRYREWYGSARGDDPNVGLKMRSEDVAVGIAERSQGETYSYSVADPSIFIRDGGPCIAESMHKAARLTFRPADNSRIPGWVQVRSRLIGEDERPLIYFFATCLDSIRTLPIVQHDEHKPEDVDTDGEDHAPDDIRYACMSRPIVARPPESEKGIRTIHDATLDELWDLQRKQTSRRI
jgi:hypothetical protein